MFILYGLATSRNKARAGIWVELLSVDPLSQTLSLAPPNGALLSTARRDNEAIWLKQIDS